MSDVTPDNPQNPESTMPVSAEFKRKPRIMLGTFWLLIAALLIFVGFSGTWWIALLGIATFAYSIYLYRGGRFGFWFI